MPEKADAVRSLDDVHLRLRRGEFAEDLLDTARTHADAWRQDPRLDVRLKGLYVEAEILDYFGQYAESAERLRTAGPEQREELVRHVRAETWRDEELAVSKRRIWVAMAYATALYRREHYDDALAVLEDCAAAVDAVASGDRPLYGTRTRLAYSRGQVLRQLHDYTSARQQFERAVVFARQRFTSKTPYAELPAGAVASPGAAERESFERDRLLAQGTVGRCLALGLGWIAYTTGLLSSASMLLSGGYTMLRGTGDDLHRAYTVLLLGAVERARAGDDPVGLAASIALMQDGARGLKTHPAYSLRACYELALAHYKDPKQRPEARRQLQTLKAGVAGGTEKRSARWMSAALVVESRVERLDGNIKAAERLAQKAVTEAQRAGARHEEFQAEALIALGEAFRESALHACTRRAVEQGARYREGALDAFRRALALGGANPKIAVVSHLHLARVYAAHGYLAEAMSARSAAAAMESAVEHGFVRSLAKTVSEEIGKHDTFFVDGRVESLRNADHLPALEAFLFRQAKARGASAAEWAAALGVPESTIAKRQRRLVAAGQDVGERRLPGRPPKNRQR
jgi:tetratricopeptide (TPR) repeat protein